MRGDILDSRGVQVFQEPLDEAGAPIPSMRIKKHVENSVYSRERKLQERLPSMPLPCAGLRQDLDTESQNT